MLRLELWLKAKYWETLPTSSAISDLVGSGLSSNSLQESSWNSFVYRGHLEWHRSLNKHHKLLKQGRGQNFTLQPSPCWHYYCQEVWHRKEYGSANQGVYCWTAQRRASTWSSGKSPSHTGQPSWLKGVQCWCCNISATSSQGRLRWLLHLQGLQCISPVAESFYQFHVGYGCIVQVQSLSSKLIILPCQKQWQGQGSYLSSSVWQLGG